MLVQHVERGDQELMGVLLFITRQVTSVRPDQMKQSVRRVRHAGARVELSHHTDIKGEINVDKKWQSDDLFYIIMNEIRRRVDQF